MALSGRYAQGLLGRGHNGQWGAARGAALRQRGSVRSMATGCVGCAWRCFRVVWVDVSGGRRGWVVVVVGVGWWCVCEGGGGLGRRASRGQRW